MTDLENDMASCIDPDGYPDIGYVFGCVAWEVRQAIDEYHEEYNDPMRFDAVY